MTNDPDHEPKGCPLLTAGQYADGAIQRWEPCREDECQLWWLCSGDIRPVFMADKEAK